MTKSEVKGDKDVSRHTHKENEREKWQKGETEACRKKRKVTE